ncbi:hypothetical protein HDU92_007020 [Lobulomyces angularis]|nr:hypothetical protein HDU92_007020 [Lobulomyces angularis]
MILKEVVQISGTLVTITSLIFSLYLMIWDLKKPNFLSRIKAINSSATLIFNCCIYNSLRLVCLVLNQLQMLKGNPLYFKLFHEIAFCTGMVLIGEITFLRFKSLQIISEKHPLYWRINLVRTIDLMIAAVYTISDVIWYVSEGEDIKNVANIIYFATLFVLTFNIVAVEGFCYMRLIGDIFHNQVELAINEIEKHQKRVYRLNRTRRRFRMLYFILYTNSSVQSRNQQLLWILDHSTLLGNSLPATSNPRKPQR